MQSIKEIEKNLKDRLEKATFKNNIAEKITTQDLLDKFLKYKNTSVNKKSHSRKFSNENEKALKAVSKAIA